MELYLTSHVPLCGLLRDSFYFTRREKYVDLQMREELTAHLPWPSALCNFGYSTVVLCQVRILHNIGVALETIHRLLLYAAQYSCCVCLSVCLHRHIPMLNLHTLSQPLQSLYNLQSGTKHIQYLNCHVSINTQLLRVQRADCLWCRLVFWC